MTTSMPSLARAERLALCHTLRDVGPDAPTLCGTWRARELAAHLVIRERRPDLAAGMFVPLLEGRLESGMDDYAAKPWAALVDLVQDGPPFWHPTRVGKVDDLVNTVEMLVHHEDVLRGDGHVGPTRELGAAEQRAAWRALGTPLTKALVRGAPCGVTMTAPGHGTRTIKAGDPRVVVTGAPLELLLVAFGRQQVAAVDYDGPADAVERLRTASLGF